MGNDILYTKQIFLYFLTNEQFFYKCKDRNLKMLDFLVWIVIVGAIVMFIMAFGIGANDVANTLGTSIGSKVLTFRQAIVVASIFEFTGAALMGSHVTVTIRKKIVDITVSIKSIAF